MEFRIAYSAKVKDYLEETSKVQKLVAVKCLESMLEAAELMIDTFKSGGKILLCGNGGSAADCQHMATELVSSLSKEFDRPGLPAIALTTDTSFLTAYSNDNAFEGIFERQVLALGKSGDVLVGISTSGNSDNVVRAVRSAHEIGLRTIALTGGSGQLGNLAEVNIKVPSYDTQHIQEAHLAIEHILCYLIEDSMFSQVDVSIRSKDDIVG